MEIVQDASWHASSYLYYSASCITYVLYALVLLFRWRDKKNREFIQKFNDTILKKGSIKMADHKSYPQYSTFQTSTVLSCAKCKTEITMYTPVVTDGTSCWHGETCAPPKVEPSEVHTVEVEKEKVPNEN
jgi:hypothetical protein